MASLLKSFLLSVIVFSALPSAATANPIPFPVPASMPLEEMHIAIGSNGHVSFQGLFTFDYIPATVSSMLFPMPPENVGNIHVYEDAVELPWTWSGASYPTVLPEYSSLSMIEWSGPFPTGGAIFGVDYEHELITRPNSWVFFYSLGTGKYFPTYDKITTANFDIILPVANSVKGIYLDNMPLDPSLYTLDGTQLSITLTSEYGPFTQDLMIELNRLPEPGVLWLLSIGGVLMLLGSRRKPPRGVGTALPLS